MKKLLFILIALLSFTVYAQEADSKSEPTFDSKALESANVSQLILHHKGVIGVATYDLLDGTRLSNRDLNKILRTVPENGSLLTKKNVWTAICVAFNVGLVAGVTMSAYATSKDWTVMAHNSAMAAIGCAALAETCNIVAHSYKARAVDNYNLRVMGIQLN